MKPIFAALTLALTLAFATVAFAGTSSFTACTTDNKQVTLVVNYSDELAAQHPVVAHIGKSFYAAAHSMTAADLQTGAGAKAFFDGLDVQDFEAITGLGGAPTVTGTCK